jgi:Zn-dependent protease
VRNSWRIGSLFGIPLYIDPSWFLILAFVTFINAGDVNANGLSNNTPFVGWIAGLVLALLLFGSVLLHELGHSLAARSQGISVNSITLFLFGGIASIERESRSPEGAFWVAIAGPSISLLLFGIFFILAQLAEDFRLIAFIGTDLARINLVVALFNLIPGLPLDGGQIFKAIVWKVKGDRLTGVKWAATSGKIIGAVGIACSLLLLILTGEIGTAWIALIGWFVLRNANTYARLTKLQESLLSLVANDSMTREFRTIDANLTLSEFAREYIHAGTNTAPIYYAVSQGRYRGAIKVEDLYAIERSEWDNKTLLDIARPLSEIPSVQEKTPLVEVVNYLEAIKERQITVLSLAGAVAGTIDRGDLVRAIATKQNLPISDQEIKRIKAEGTYPAFLQLNAIAKGITDNKS